MTVGRNVTTNSRMKTVNKTATVSGTQVTLYTCPANCRAHVSMLMITNVNGTASVDCTFNRAADSSTMHILGGKNLSTGEYVLFTGAEMVMEPGDTIKYTPTGSTPTVDVMATVEEFFVIPG
jgi:hypothetical protein